MLPILDQPVAAYAVPDCLAAGADQIAIVTGAGETGRQVRRYFTEDISLKDTFTTRGWQEKYQPVAHLHEQAQFTFIEQPRDGRYGTALPVVLAADFIKGDAFILLAGDDLLLRSDGGHDLVDLTSARTMAGTPGAIAAATVPGGIAHRYGVITPKTNAGGHQVLDSLVERSASQFLRRRLRLSRMTLRQAASRSVKRADHWEQDGPVYASASMGPGRRVRR
ncbi:sugar phosphate nucleotidyltransferase [Streptomyces roseus]|uniref:sugar phosphate nucleotidyltransferase n=1 Tax=Streptomyces roseus TaxID=66430 RepID=UPI0037FA8A5F